MAQKGSVFLYIIYFVVIMLAIGLVWFYLHTQDAFGGLNVPLPFFESQPTFSTAGWKQFRTDGGKITFQYPPGWFVTENQFVSQYPYTPGKYSADIYNAVSVRPILGQLQVSYDNQSWFDLVYGAKDGTGVANQYHSTDRNQVTKQQSFRTLKGNKAVIFIDEMTQFTNQQQAYLFVDSTRMYQFTIENYDQSGLDLFKKIVSTAVVN